jgi:hypothetical protein
VIALPERVSVEPPERFRPDGVLVTMGPRSVAAVTSQSGVATAPTLSGVSLCPVAALLQDPGDPVQELPQFHADGREASG